MAFTITAGLSRRLALRLLAAWPGKGSTHQFRRDCNWANLSRHSKLVNRANSRRAYSSVHRDRHVISIESKTGAGEMDDNR